MSYKIAITGASGFIGTNLLQYFIDRGYDVINIDFKRPRNNAHFKYWLDVDILDEKSLERTVDDFCPDYMVHLAARTDLEGKVLNDYEANTTGVKNILNAVKKCESVKKVLITSSMLVCKAGYQPKNQFDYCPVTKYGESKVITERNVWNDQPACDWAILRPTSIWGPWFGIPYRNFFDMIISRRYFHIGDRSCTKTYGYVGNTVYQIERLLFTSTTDIENKIFYLGDSPPSNIESWADEIAFELNYRIMRLPYYLIKMAALGGDVLGFLHIRFPMTSFRLKNMTTDNVIDLNNVNVIAPTPPYSRIDGVKKTIEWLRNIDKEGI